MVLSMRLGINYVVLALVFFIFMRPAGYKKLPGTNSTYICDIYSYIVQNEKTVTT